jgi:3-hydroxyisobutyrate dehydrogenase
MDGGRVTDPIIPPAAIGFIGLGEMGLPMALRLRAAGYGTAGMDVSTTACAAFALAGGTVAHTAAAAATGAATLITMLPTGRIVRDALLGTGGAAAALPAGSLVIDMSSSAPTDTQALGRDLADRGIALIDAPVSGGVRRARDGTLAIMAGGDPADIERARPVLAAMGKTVFLTGALGSGHAMKALNNYVSAAGLVAAAEALQVGSAFGLAPETIIDVLNASTGRNNATDVKMKQFVISRSFASGFSLALMAKDLRTAADLASHLGINASGIAASASLWQAALEALGNVADHTEIARFLDARPKASPDQVSGEM